MARADGRDPRSLRPVEIVPGFHRLSEGSCLYRAGGTVVLCTASIDSTVPAFLEGKGTGWITAEYQMHPRSNPTRREARDGRGKAPSGRTQEIQRLIGRALRAAVDLSKLGQRTIALDCDVIEADGGTRTASITGGFVALALAVRALLRQGVLAEDPRLTPVAAVSVGLVAPLEGSSVLPLLDLSYSEDSRAGVDLNVVMQANGGLIEVQGTGERGSFSRAELNSMLDLAEGGIRRLCEVQQAALLGGGP